MTLLPFSPYSRYLKNQKPWGLLLARSAEVSLVVSHVSVMPRRSMPLLVTRSNGSWHLIPYGTGIAVPRWRQHTPGPGLKLTLHVSKRSKEKSKVSRTLAGGRIFLLPQRKRDGMDSKDGEREPDIASVLLQQHIEVLVGRLAGISPCQ